MRRIIGIVLCVCGAVVIMSAVYFAKPGKVVHSSSGRFGNIHSSIIVSEAGIDGTLLFSGAGMAVVGLLISFWPRRSAQPPPLPPVDE